MADLVQRLSKKRSVEKEKGQKHIDQLSNLPDSIICHILSFLPTKLSVATGTLSKRWKHLWTAVPVLSFSSAEFIGTLGSFVDSIGKFLTNCQAQNVYQFTIDFKPFLEVDEENLGTWVAAAVERNVQELKLSLNFSHVPTVRLPGRLFACRTLVSLKLIDNIFIDLPENVCLQSLRTLQLERLHYANEGSFNILLSGCPVLEDLVVWRILDDGILDMVINIASLKRLNLRNSNYEANHHGLLIIAPLLERIELSQNVLDFQIDSSSLVEAIINIHGTCDSIEAFDNLEFLSLSQYALHGMAFHEFHNLVCLETTTSCAQWDDLEELLHGSNNLKTLVYHIEVPILHRGHMCDKSFSKTVPVCVSASLKALKLTGFINQNCNWTFIQYMLKNAKFLEEVKIRTSSMLKKRRRHIRNMLNCPRASTECQIRFFLDSTGEEYRF
ncbi:F-box/FBD/LRR-repeat protein At3g52680-like [Hibiscus syriacus]|nr:F-box/FBD/LRR-repeat protein At3g52680-like [Hibiscus syriacus]